MVVRTLSYYYADAPADVREAGARWYRQARQQARRYAKRWGVTLQQAVGVIAVLSQRQHWHRNLELARRCLAGEDYNCLAQVKRKAEAIRAGADPLDVIKGPKITAFYHAILGDVDAVVLDTHMLKVMGRARPTPKQYELFADRLRAAAREAGVTPAAFQAVVWVQVRGSVS